jgi:glycosyltransferase involved in cell wall biosynthesis
MKISACLIVKNEEENLQRCLESIKELVDEIVIVDTGSTDKTIEIAERYTDKLYIHPWQNDFSLHRNQSISYATGDWILIIDADEELSTNLTKDDIKELISKASDETDSISFLMEDIQNDKVVMNCVTSRIFRNGKIRYNGRVHNQPSVDGKTAITTAIKIKHYGYDLSPERMQQKFERTLSLLLKQYENNENEHVEFYLCQLYGQNGMQEESQKWGELYYKKRDLTNIDFNTTIYFTLIKSYIDTGNMQRAWEIIQDALKLDRPDPDIGLAISDFGAKKNDLNIMGYGCKKYLNDVKLIKDNPIDMTYKFYFSLREDIEQLIIYRLCMVCFYEGIDLFNKLKERLENLDYNILKELKNNLKLLNLTSLLEQIKNVQV